MFNPLSGSAPEPARLSPSLKPQNLAPVDSAAPTAKTVPVRDSAPSTPAAHLPDTTVMKQDLEAMGALEVQFERVGRATPVLNSLFEQLGPFQGTGIDQSDRVSSGQASPVIGSVPGNGQDDPLLGLIRTFKATFQSHP